MSRDRDEWLTRIKAVERQHAAIRFATERVLEAVRQDPTILQRALEPRDIREASDHLEATYLVRLFAEFESGLRHFWQVARPNRRRTRTEHLLNGIAAARGIPTEFLDNAHTVRKYRNNLVHEREEAVDPVPIALARRHLCLFFSRLPPEW
jgi:hypothetical protein